MDVVRHSEFKNDTVLSFDCMKANDELINKSIQYRYNKLRQEYIMFSQAYEDMAETVKSKNPSLMMQIAKALRKK